MEFETLCIHAAKNEYDSTGAVNVPIYQSATFAHPAVGQSTGFDYSRGGNPTRTTLEKTVASLEQGAGAIAFSSGMAAIAAFMELFAPGDHLLVTDDIYGGTHRLFHTLNEKNGIRFSSFTKLEQLPQLLNQNTRAIFIETPTNPNMDVVDIAAVAAFAKQHQLLVAVDNTFLTPYLQKPILLGADFVLHSGTKYLGGHNDTLAGFLVSKNPEHDKKLRYIAMTTGACLSPFDAFLLQRGIKTLPIRMDCQQKNTMIIAEWLQQQPQVRAVNYPGLPGHAGHALSRKQASGFGAMLSFSVESEALARHILNHVKIIQYAESLGGTETLITYPMLQTHADIPEAERLAKGIDGCLLRLSAGIEATADLLADLAQAFRLT